jgi:hypothetical protein
MMEQNLIQETLESMRDYVPKLVAASEKLAYDIQTHEGGWPDYLIAYLEGIAWLTMAINGIQQLDQDILANCDINLLAPLIDHLKLALEQQDFVSLCDLLQYEMLPLLQSYDAELRGIVH